MPNFLDNTGFVEKTEAVALRPQTTNPDAGTTSGFGDVWADDANKLHFKRPDGTDTVVPQTSAADGAFAAGALKQANAGGTAATTMASNATAARTATFPDASGTVAVSASAPATLSAAGDIGVSNATATNGGAGNADKVLKLDGAGKLAGRVIETDGATLDALAAGADNGVSRVRVEIAAADVKALNATPIQVIAAPVAGKYLDIVSLHAWLDFGTVGYDAVAAGDNLTLVYDGETADLVEPIAGAGFGDAVADAHRVTTGKGDATPKAAASVKAKIKVGEWRAAAGDSPLKLEVLYRTRDLTW